jgi:hypothetical protein
MGDAGRRSEMGHQSLAFSEGEGDPQRCIFRPSQQSTIHQRAHEPARPAVVDTKQGRDITARHHTEQDRLSQERLHPGVEPSAGRFVRDKFTDPPARAPARSMPA